MAGHDLYLAKAVEYLLGVAFLLLFVPFWRYATGGVGTTLGAARRVRLAASDLFQIPAHVMLHPGHAWARVDAPDTVAAGMDDFARQLIGPLKGVVAPPIGSRVEQGGRAWTLKADSRAVDMLSPISGTVVAVNEEGPRAAPGDPYGRWLIKIRPARLDADAKQLLTSRAARQYLVASWDELSSLLSPELGTIMHDGGTPISGFARGIDEEHWDLVARRLLRS